MAVPEQPRASASARLDPFSVLSAQERQCAAVTGLSLDGDAEHHVTFEGLARRSLALARAFKLGGPATSRGLPPPAPLANVALLSRNRAEYLEVVLAAIASGAWLTPINWHLTAPEISYILEDSESSLVIADPDLVHLLPEGCEALLLGEAYEALLQEQLSLADAALAYAAAELVSLDVLEAEGRALLEQLEAAAAVLDPDAAPGGVRIYTSGTSGRPKGVERQRADSVEHAWAALRSAGAAVGLCAVTDSSGSDFSGTDSSGTDSGTLSSETSRDQAVHLICGPMYHAAPLMFAVYDLLGGARVCILPRWDERAFLRAVSLQRVTHTHLVPTMCVRLLALDPTLREAADVSSLSLVLHGAAPISEAIKQRMIDWLGPTLLEYWGATEGGVYTMIDSLDWLEHRGSVGKALSKFRVFAADDAGNELPPGELGTLYCQHLQLERPFIYHRAEDKTASAYLAPGTFTAGDLGHVDQAGYVYLSARRSNLILSGGVNVYPAEIEGELLELPWVADCAAFGVPDAEWGEQVRAAVELSAAGLVALGELGEARLVSEMLDALSARLAKYKRPRSVVLVAELPRLPTGKVRHAALREL